MRVVVAILLVAVCATAQQSYTVDQLVSFLSSSIQLHHPDKEVAAFLAKTKLTEKLEDKVIEDLQGQGAGPKTMAALRELRDATANLSQPVPKAPKAPPPQIPPPSSEEQAAIIGEARDYAINYSTKLPNFICTQVTRRYFDPSGMEFWRQADTVTVRLSFFEQHENYKLVLINNQYTDKKIESIGGAQSFGEFGSLLKLTMARKAQAQIEWDHWATLRGKRAYVFSYRVSSYNSDWRLSYEKSQEIITGYRGLIFVEKDSHVILRITLEAEGIPASFPVQQASSILDYDYTKISGQEFLLPLKYSMRLRHEKFLSKNESEYRLYNKFSADATVSFDTPDPLPEDQTKEQPAQTKEQPAKQH